MAARASALNSSFVILIIVLPMACNGLDILDRGIPRTLSDAARRAVLGGFATLVNTITPFTPYTAGRTFSDTIVIEGQRVFLRLWFFVNPNADNGEGCSTTPNQGDTVMGFNLVTAFREIHDEIGERILQWGYSFLTAINQRFGMEYVVEDARELLLVKTEMPSPQGLILVSNDSFLSSWKMPEFKTNYTVPLDWNADDCFPFESLLRSGHAGILYSQLDSGNSLKSHNARFTFTMQTDCNLVLYDEQGPLWASATQGRGSGCYLQMQNDGNLVINTLEECIWAINKYVEGQIIASVLAVQNDGNVVVYRTDDQSAVWATNTQR